MPARGRSTAGVSRNCGGRSTIRWPQANSRRPRPARQSSTSWWPGSRKRFGLGGRDRRAASAAERARLNVTRALRAATAKLALGLPGAGEGLERRIRTGLYCAYEPVPGDEVRWIVQP